jgi:hypothetical protein
MRDKFHVLANAEKQKRKEQKNKTRNNIMPNAPCAASTQCILGGFAPGAHKCPQYRRRQHQTICGAEGAVTSGVRLTPDATATPTPARATRSHHDSSSNTTTMTQEETTTEETAHRTINHTRTDSFDDQLQAIFIK